MNLPKRIASGEKHIVDAIIYLMSAIAVSDQSLKREEIEELNEIGREYGVGETYIKEVLSKMIKLRKAGENDKLIAVTKESVDMLKGAPQMTISFVIDKAKRVMEADGVISKSEEQIYAYMIKQLAR